MTQNAQNTAYFTLQNFEGPLDFLLHLIQKSELAITDIPLHELTTQFLSRLETLKDHSIEQGAEFIGITSLLISLKSRMLLPRHEQTETDENENDPRFEIIHLLIEYCRFKQMAKEMTKIELEQEKSFPRGKEPIPETEKTLGLEHLALEDLYSLFEKVLSQTPDTERKKISEETFRVFDKIRFIRSTFKKENRILFHQLFSPESSKEELIVTFLAVLELMKNGEASVFKETESGKILLMKKEQDAEHN